jgi:hypothetical protein
VWCRSARLPRPNRILVKQLFAERGDGGEISHIRRFRAARRVISANGWGGHHLQCQRGSFRCSAACTAPGQTPPAERRLLVLMTAGSRRQQTRALERDDLTVALRRSDPAGGGHVVHGRARIPAGGLQLLTGFRSSAHKRSRLAFAVRLGCRLHEEPQEALVI